MSITFLFFLLIWIAFNGRVTSEILLFGIALSALLYLFFCRFMGYSPRTDWKILSNLPLGVHYLLLLIWEVIKANWQTIKLIMSPRIEIEPTLFYFKTSLRSDFAKVVLANSITLTPGTITCNLADDGTFLVHSLDGEMARRLLDSKFIRLLSEGENNGGN